MSKLSPTLKALIAAPWARPDVTPASKSIRAVYSKIRNEAEERDVGVKAWLTFSSAATFTMNSPESLVELWHLATENLSEKKDLGERVYRAELIREVGLKCIGFNGVPRTINSLGAFRAGLPQDVISELSTTPTRHLTPQNITQINTRGQNLWTSIYHPFSNKLSQKLSLSHPDLPIFIIAAEYGALFSDPPSRETGATVGRVLTSLVAVACLRAQTGVGPQVTSHIFGLRKAFGDGDGEEGEKVEGGRWLAGDEGNVWLLGCVDRIVEGLGRGKGTSFAPGFERAKL